MSNSQASCILMLRASVVLTVPGCGAVEPTDGAVASGVNLILWVMGADQNVDPLNNIFDQSLNILLLLLSKRRMAELSEEKYEQHIEIITKNPTYLLVGARGCTQAPQLIVVLDRMVRSVASPPLSRDEQRMRWRVCEINFLLIDSNISLNTEERPNT
uniref:Uncharacterized protein n=1 Tax=Oryza glaberrima TaxID=4538 RepID=I1PJZ6_ORYGL